VTLAGRRPVEVIGTVCVLGGAFTRARTRVSEDCRWSSVSPRLWVFRGRGEAGALTAAVTEFEGDCVWAGGRPKCSTGSPFDERGLRRVKRSVKRESTRAWHSSSRRLHLGNCGRWAVLPSSGLSGWPVTQV